MEALRGGEIVAGHTGVSIRGSERGHPSTGVVVITSTLVYEAIWAWIISWRRWWWTHGRVAIGHVLCSHTIRLMRAVTSSSILRCLLVWILRNIASGWGRCRRRIVRIRITTKHNTSSAGMGMMHRMLTIERLRWRKLGGIRSHAVELVIVRRDEWRRHLISRSRC